MKANYWGNMGIRNTINRKATKVLGVGALIALPLIGTACTNVETTFAPTDTLFKITAVAPTANAKLSTQEISYRLDMAGNIYHDKVDFKPINPTPNGFHEGRAVYVRNANIGQGQKLCKTVNGQPAEITVKTTWHVNGADIGGEGSDTVKIAVPANIAGGRAC